MLWVMGMSVTYLDAMHKRVVSCKCIDGGDLRVLFVSSYSSRQTTNQAKPLCSPIRTGFQQLQWTSATLQYQYNSSRIATNLDICSYFFNYSSTLLRVVDRSSIKQSRATLRVEYSREVGEASSTSERLCILDSAIRSILVGRVLLYQLVECTMLQYSQYYSRAELPFPCCMHAQQNQQKGER